MISSNNIDINKLNLSMELHENWTAQENRTEKKVKSKQFFMSTPINANLTFQTLKIKKKILWLRIKREKIFFLDSHKNLRKNKYSIFYNTFWINYAAYIKIDTHLNNYNVQNYKKHSK